MDPLPPIPTPFEQRWREFRIQVLPVIVFIGIVAAVVLLWQDYVQPVGMVGHVESVKANAASVTEGVLVRLAVDRFDTVTAGQEIGEVMAANPDLLKAELSGMKAELKVTQARMQIDDQRREFDYQGLALDLMEHKIDYAENMKMLIYRSNEFVRISKLSTDSITSESQLDEARALMESLTARVKEQSSLIESLTQTISQLRFSNGSLINSPVDEAIQAKQQEIDLALKPLKIYAPIDGMVSMIYRRQGESVVSGEPILTINASKADHIVGYLRQPIDEFPEVNSPVEVVTHGRRRLKGEGQVVQVGSAFEPIEPTLASATTTMAVELGLPILISIPAELKDQVRPGESVAIALKSAKN